MLYSIDLPNGKHINVKGNDGHTIDDFLAWEEPETAPAGENGYNIPVTARKPKILPLPADCELIEFDWQEGMIFEYLAHNTSKITVSEVVKVFRRGETIDCIKCNSYQKDE